MAVISATAFHRGKTLGDDELHPPQDRCPICGDGRPRRAVVRLQDDPEVSFLACGNCSGISASRMPTDPALADYYANYYDRVATELVTTPRPERLAWLIADRFAVNGRPGTVKILDFGGGDGTIALLAAERLIANRTAERVEVLVVDYVRENPRALSPDIELAFAARLEDVGGLFDIVIASAILEHIPDFRRAFDGLMAHSAPGALFYARTPFMTPFGRRVPIDLTYPAHVHDLGAAFWAWLANNAGVPIRVLEHAPSLVETVIETHPLRTIAAHVMKTPARLLAAAGLPAIWPFYGGWQVIWRIDRS